MNSFHFSNSAFVIQGCHSSLCQAASNCNLLYSARLLHQPLLACRWRITAGIYLRGTHLSSSGGGLGAPGGEVPLLLDDVNPDMAEKQQMQEEPMACPESRSDTVQMKIQLAGEGTWRHLGTGSYTHTYYRGRHLCSCHHGVSDHYVTICCVLIHCRSSGWHYVLCMPQYVHLPAYNLHQKLNCSIFNQPINRNSTSDCLHFLKNHSSNYIRRIRNIIRLYVWIQ